MAHDLYNEDYLKGMFTDCIKAGAEFTHEGENFALKFPIDIESDGFYFSFTMLDGETVSMFSDVAGMEGSMPVDEFLGGLDVISAKLLSVFDGIDRGV